MILLNSNDENVLKSIKNDNKRYIKWATSLASHPELLSKRDLSNIIKSDDLFARKFDDDSDPEILDMIDDFCLRLPIGNNFKTIDE